MQKQILVLVAASGTALAALGAGTEDNTVADTEHGILWTQGGNGEDINFDSAKAYCEALELAGRSQWRLPSLEEARSLYRPDADGTKTYDYRGQPYPLRIDPAFDLTAPGIWTDTIGRRGAPTAYFYSSGRLQAWRGEHSRFQRALCVHEAGP